MLADIDRYRDDLLLVTRHAWLMELGSSR